MASRTPLPDKITPTDPRIAHKTVLLNGQTYSYILASPSSPTHTIILIHGWPDLAFGWRYQIPLLLGLNLRVVAINMMGYSQTASPQELENYTFKRAADDISALAKELGVEKVILGGHDWGGAIIYRIALWNPELVEAMFSICTPFWPPQKEYMPASVLPNFKYQIQLASGEVENKLSSGEKIGQFLNGIYGGRTKSGNHPFTVDHGIHFNELDGMGKSPLLNEEEINFYVKEYERNGLRGPLNWYRTSELNFADEKVLYEKFEKEGLKFTIPTLFVAGKKDAALPPSLSEGMEGFWKQGLLRRGEVDAGHWALWERPAEVNGLIEGFLKDFLNRGGAGKAAL